MKRIENEEYSVDENQIIDEIQYFEAEEFKIKEIISNNMEDFKVKEIQIRTLDEASKKTSIEKPDSLRKKLNNIKTGVNTAATTTASASIALVAALGVGAIVIDPVDDIIDFGTVQYINYYVEYEEVDDVLNENVKINFEKDLNDGFYTIVINKETEEIKTLNHEFITFYNVDENTTFEVVTKDEKDNIVDSFEVSVSTVSPYQYLGVGSMNYNLIQNPDDTVSLEMILEVYDEGLIPKAYLSDLNGNDLDYESVYYEDKLIINNIVDEEFNLNAFLYKEENNNYFAVQSYKILNYNLENPINAELERVEVLNSSYSYDGSVPTEIYLDGYLSSNDYLDILVYNQTGEIIDEQLNINDLNYPITFNDLPTDEEVIFDYKLYHYGNVIKKGSYQTSLAIKEEYLDASYDYGAINPGDVMATYNKDGTYNAYFNSGFRNNSEYDMIYKIELNDGMVNRYEYIGNEAIGYIHNIDSNDQFSLVHKVMIKEDKTYYAIYDYYLASGSFGVTRDEEGNMELQPYLDVFEADTPKTYQFSSYQDFKEDLLVTAILSTGETLEFKVMKDSLNDYENYPSIDLNDYEYESVKFIVKVLANPIYGMGDMIIESGIDIYGDIYTEFILEFEF